MQPNTLLLLFISDSRQHCQESTRATPHTTELGENYEFINHAFIIRWYSNGFVYDRMCAHKHSISLFSLAHHFHDFRPKPNFTGIFFRCLFLFHANK